MKIKTSELIGKPLDYAVCYALYGEQAKYIMKHAKHVHKYGSDWSHGGPIIEQEGIWLRGPHDATKPNGVVVLHIDCWYAHINHQHTQNGPTPLIAAMRCYVSSKLGDEVEIPEELA
jgi:hypothetical protein